MKLSDFISKPSLLTITAFLDTDRSKPASEPNKLEVPWNPDSLSILHEHAFQAGQASPSSSAQARFAHAQSRQLSVTLVFNGIDLGPYGVEELLAKKPSVAEQVNLFLALCQQLNSDSHEPSYLRLTWSTKGVLGPNFDCRLKSVDTKYTSFDKDGAPLHAELATVFLEDVSVSKKAAKDRLASPDLTHRHIVKAGETLPMLCRMIYGSAEHYMRVAEVNGLDTVLLLSPGQVVIFPPYAKEAG